MESVLLVLVLLSIFILAIVTTTLFLYIWDVAGKLGIQRGKRSVQKEEE